MPGNTVTRFPNGLTNEGDSHSFADLGQPNATKFHTYFEDFDSFTASQWTITRVGTTPTEALTDIDGGALLLTMAATDDSSSSLQKVGESFLMEVGKETFFRARFRVSDAVQSDFVLGLQITDTTPLDVTDGIYFIKDDGDAQLDIVVRKDATTGSNRVNNIATVVSNTFMTVEWVYDGVDKVFYGVNGTLLGSLSATSAFLPDTELTISIHMQNGEASSKQMVLDYIYVCKERG